MRGATQGRPCARVRVLRCLLLAILVMLAMMATGCDELLADILLGDGCGTHDVCSTKAAIAGGATGATALAVSTLQRREEEENGSDTGEGSDDKGDSGGGFQVDWSLRQRPSDDHVWDANENKWVLRPSEEDQAQAMRDKGYEFDEDYGDGGAWRKKVDKLEPVEIPKEKGNVTLPEYKSGLISPTAEASYDRLEARYDQLDEMEQKAIDDYKRIRNEFKDAQESGDTWLAERLKKNLETARDNVDRMQAEKDSLTYRHDQHSDQQFQKRYTEGWTVGKVASELFIDPFVHMIAPDMSDTVDVMANAIAARNKLQSQIGRQKSKLFDEHDQAMKDLRDVIKQRREALDRGDTEAAAKLKEKGEGIKDRLKDVTKRIESFHSDNIDYQKKALNATLETGKVGADRVITGRAAYETTKYVGGKVGFQTQKPEIQAKRPAIEEAETAVRGEAKQVRVGETEVKPGKGAGTEVRQGKGAPTKVKQVEGVKSGAKQVEGAKAGAKQIEGVKKSAGGGGSGGGKSGGGSGGGEGGGDSGGGRSGGGSGGGSSSGGGGKPPKKSLQQMVRDNPTPEQKLGRRAEAKAGWEQQYQADAEKLYGKGNVPETRGRKLPSTEKEWLARDAKLGVDRGGPVKDYGELSGINPDERVLAMRQADPDFAKLDIKVRECWQKAGPGVGPGFKPDYFNDFEANLRNANVSDAEFQGWRKAIETGRYEAPGGYTPPSRPPTIGSPSLPPRQDPTSPRTYVPPPKK
jgi:hypothetical protein